MWQETTANLLLIINTSFQSHVHQNFVTKKQSFNRHQYILVLSFNYTTLTFCRNCNSSRGLRANFILCLTVVKSTGIRGHIEADAVTCAANKRFSSSPHIPGVVVHWWVGITAAGQSHRTALHYLPRTDRH